MKKLSVLLLLLSTFSFAGDLHLAKHAGKAGLKGAKLAAKGANKLRKQVL